MTTTEFSKQTSTLAPYLLQFAMRYTNDAENANDLVQDTMVKAFKYHAQFEEGSNLKGWLFTIMKNTFINDYRRKVRSQSLITKTDELSSSDLSLSASRNSAEGSMIMKDIQIALKSIPECYSKPFISHFEGFKYHEIAEELNMPIGTVKTRIHIARKLLKEYLTTYAKYDYKKGMA
ncbi:sigma-70 family RNA polymerase sigma factor [Pedobacter aquatilis]|uniref:sigma-70 family RNA polymerase sigma factor n=1 Tax=Pedobacter aquatilis TaxID=351343 RepID=UPI00292D7301|nr:sigma-70 family RNA polymerase sigma factor [Pedobacter aquatilis]